MIQTFIRQFRITDSYESSVQAALDAANKAAAESRSEIVSVTTLSGVGVNNWKLIVAYRFISDQQ